MDATRAQCILGLLPWLALCAPATTWADEAGSRWAILIGVNDYAEIADLEYCSRDMQSLEQQLVASGFPDRQVFLLSDGAKQAQYLPFKRNIEKQLELVLGLVEKDDLVLVAFSGHGVLRGGNSYLCPTDASLDDATGTLVSVEKVYEQLQKCPAALKVMLVDACRNDPQLAGQKSLKATRDVSQPFLAALDRPPRGILLLTSCAPGEVSMEDKELRHGVFMHHVLQGLQGAADLDRSGGVSLSELWKFANRETKLHVARKFNDSQRPGLRGDLTDDFDLTSVVAAATSIPTPARPTSTPSPSAKAGEVITNSIGMKLVRIPAGEFFMGSTVEDLTKMVALDPLQFKAENASREQPRHSVKITRPFYLGRFEVTRGQFAAFVAARSFRTEGERDGNGAVGWNESEGKFDGSKPEYTWKSTGFAQDDSHPVVNVSWNDAVAFCEWLSEKEGRIYRLPTEAEWEYACRAGGATLWHHGDDPEGLARVANVGDATAKDKLADASASYSEIKYLSSRDGYVFTAPPGQYEPNAFGLYDMHGNVEEWCADWYDAKAYQGRTGTTADPLVRSASWNGRVERGGNWTQIAAHVRSAMRSGHAPDDRGPILGFRVARSE